MKKYSFTLVELMIVLAILALLAGIVIFVVKPIDILTSARDTKRISELQSISKSVQYLENINLGNLNLGTPYTVYISLPDNTSTTCSSYALASLPTGYTYSCKNATDYQKNDSTGWIPVNFRESDNSNILATLPVDPLNTIYYYYSYIPGGSFELTGRIESSKNISKATEDTGDDPTRFETGTNLSLNPFSFEFVTFPTVANNSNKPGWYANSAVGSASIMSDNTSNNFLRISGGLGWYIWQENIPYNPNLTYELTCKVRQTTDPISGTKLTWCGWIGVANDGTTLLNWNGNNSYGTQHYHAISNISLATSTIFSIYTGYTKGLGTPNGQTSSCPNIGSPCKMYNTVKYIRPLFILNNTGDGVADIDSISWKIY